jgi:hypothetical protein
LDPPLEAWPGPLPRWTRGVVVVGCGVDPAVSGVACGRVAPVVPVVPDVPDVPSAGGVAVVVAALAPDQLAAARAAKPTLPARPAIAVPAVRDRRRPIARRRRWM